MSGTLYIVATPIGNLEDVTLRAIRILSEVDIVLAEDTRVTKKLLDSVVSSKLLEVRKYHEQPTTNFQPPTKARLLSYHQHSGEEKKLEILRYIMDGYDIALVTDAGTPGVSDPGNELVHFLISHLPDLKIVPIPGASSLTTVLSVCGFDTSNFTFIGFWPKKKVNRVLKYIESLDGLAVFYDSPFRILKTLKILNDYFGSEKKIFVGRELTKMHETLYRGTIAEVLEKLKENSTSIKGEFVAVLKLE